jgi:hypothetical protein
MRGKPFTAKRASANPNRIAPDATLLISQAIIKFVFIAGPRSGETLRSVPIYDTFTAAARVPSDLKTAPDRIGLASKNTYIPET